MRIGVCEIIGLLIVDFGDMEELNESQLKQLESYFDLIEERFRDVNSYVRSKVLQVVARICE